MRRPAIEVVSETELLNGWSRVLRIVYRLTRRDGGIRTEDRDLLARGDGITVLLCHPHRRTVLLLRQARIAAAMRRGGDGQTLEACNGQVDDGEDPLACAHREVFEETGQVVSGLLRIGAVYASPGASLELIHIYLGTYDEHLEGAGGGLEEEGEDIEVLEVSFDQAMLWVSDGTICDGRTILALQHAALHHFLPG